MKKYSPVAIAVAALLGSATAAADSEGVNACRQVDDDTARLACYDAQFGGSSAPTKEAAPPVAPIATEAATPAAAAAAAASAKASDLGSEQVPHNTDNEVHARIVGTFNGWDGSTVFELDNGQVWRQLKNNARPWKPREPMQDPKVTVEKSLMGSYKLHVEGVKRTVQVRRIK